MDILQMSLSASVMIVAVVMIRALTLHRLPKRTFLVLWGVVICRLLIPFSIPSRFSFYTGIDRLNRMFAENEIAPSASGVIINGANTSNIAAAGESIGTGAPAATAAASVSPIEIAWFAGICICAVLFIVAYIKCRREFRTSLPVDNVLISSWLHGNTLRRIVQIRQSDRIHAPLTYGVFRPVILLPKTIDWTDEAGLKVILTHEMIHIRRFDTLTKLVLAAAVCVHWFNPFVWVMYALMNRDIELACDEAVVRTFGETMKSAYAMTLIALEEKKSAFTPLISGFSKNAIEERITAIMKIKKTSLIGIIVALALVIGTTTVFATNAAKASEENDQIDASTALEQLAGSISYENGKLSFQIPENYANPKDWNILIYGRTEQDGFGMSVHYLTEENENKSWEAGRRYVIPLTGNADNYTELWMTASLPDESGNTDDHSVDVDLLKFITSPTPSVTADSKPAILEAVNDQLDTDVEFTNGWRSALVELDVNGGKYIIVQVGSLKSDPEQGVAVVCHQNKDSEQYVIDDQFLTPDKHGAIKVESLGAKDFNMPVVAEDGYTWIFNVYNGFQAGANTEPDSQPVSTAAISNLDWVWPLEERYDRVTAPYGSRIHPITHTTEFHDHIDIGAKEGSSVYTALAGTVSETGFDTNRGNYIRITHAGGYETAYAHLKEVLVEDGAAVAAGETIGAVGQTGKATGPCLGFYVYADGEATDPLEYYTVVSADTADTEPTASPQDDSTERNGVATP